MHTLTDKSTEWPLNLTPTGQENLRVLRAAHAEASASWHQAHPGSQSAIPHKDFLRLIGVSIDSTRLSKLLRPAGYPHAGAETALQDLADGIRQWRMDLAFAQRQPDRAVHVHRWFANVKTAVTNAGARESKGSQERGVAFISPTGGGKTFLARWIKEQVGRAVIVTAKGSWRTSYYAILDSVLTALGRAVPASSRLAEKDLFRHLQENKLTLIFDEQDLFGRDALNLIRALLNETRTTVLCLMIPETWDRLVRHGGEYGKQFCRRFPDMIKQPGIEPETARPYLEEFLPDQPAPVIKELAAVLAAEANKFGSLSLVDSVALALSRIPLQPGQTLPDAARELSKIYRRRNQFSLNIQAA